MDPFLAEIRILPYSGFAPTGWAACDGQLMPISQNTALFSLLGTTYGGNGATTFGLPDFQGRVPMHHGQGSGLSLRDLGEDGGSENVTLLQSEIPLHTHSARVSGDLANQTQPGTRLLAVGDGFAMYNTNSQPITTMAPQTLSVAGGGQPHNNIQPSLVLQFCIALQGIFPPRP